MSSRGKDVELWAVYGMLRKHVDTAFVRKTGPKFEVIVPGDWTSFECLGFGTDTFERLEKCRAIEPVKGRDDRWKLSASEVEKIAPER